MKKQSAKLLLCFLIFHGSAFARECHLPTEWKSLCQILQSRVSSKTQKM